jgi:hypothetical protein
MSESAPDDRALAVIDIDGVLADVRHRLHHLSGRRRDWAAFFAAAPEDGVLPEGRSEIERALAEGLGLVYLTGRPERCRSASITWLREHGFPSAPLCMRPDNDRRPAREFKVDALREIASMGTIARVIDDDAAVVAAVASAGFPVVHAEWMHAPTAEADALGSAQERLGRT